MDLNITKHCGNTDAIHDDSKEGKGRIVAQVFHGSNSDHIGRLFTASPNLYLAASEAWGYIQTIQSDFGLIDSGVLESLRAAIAEVEHGK